MTWTEFIFQGNKEEEDCIDSSIQRLKDNIMKTSEKLITPTSNSIDNIRRNRKITKTREEKWEEKQLPGYFKQQTVKIAWEDLNMDKKGKLQEK